jgi:hypothetical protein
LGRNHLDKVAEEALDLEGEGMKQLRICYTKLVMLDIEDDMTKEEISALVDELAADEIFQDGEEFDDVEWEVLDDY